MQDMSTHMLILLLSLLNFFCERFRIAATTVLKYHHHHHHHQLCEWDFLSPTTLPHRNIKRCIVVIVIEDTIYGCVLGSCSADILSIIHFQDTRGLLDSLKRHWLLFSCADVLVPANTAAAFLPLLLIAAGRSSAIHSAAAAVAVLLSSWCQYVVSMMCINCRSLSQSNRRLRALGHPRSLS